MTIESSGNSGMDTLRPCAMLPANAMSAAPLLSVIVVCQHPAPLLEVTFASLAAQRFVQPEVVVLARGSNDSAAGWLAANPDRYAALVHAGADDTLAAGLNAALPSAHGEWVLILQAGDRLV